MSVSQRYTGRNQLINRLASQVGSVENAIGILIKRGDMTEDGKSFTKKGAERNRMTAKERAIDRATRRTGRPASDYKYNKLTNNAILR
jgi:hypothetical protein